MNVSIEDLQRSGTFRRSPRERDNVQVLRAGSPGDAPVSFYIYRDVLEELVYAADFHDGDTITVLTGGFGVEGVGFVEVTGFEYFGEIGDDVLQKVREGCESVQAAPGNDFPVGLFVSRRGGEGALDERDARVHLSLFNIPFQPVFVFDPESRLLSVYCRAPRRVFIDAPLYVVSSAADSDADGLDPSVGEG